MRFLSLFILLLSTGTHAGDDIIDPIVAGMCDRRVVMLGENGHGDGAAVSVKVELTKRLIKECGFNALLMEASFYDGMALDLMRTKGSPISQDMIKSTLGSIRNSTHEIAPLIPFLHDQVIEGSLTLAGIDNQLSIAGSFYANDQLVIDLMAHIPDPDRAKTCHDLLKNQIWGGFPADDPYDEQKRRQIYACLDTVTKNLSNDKASHINSAHIRMAENVALTLSSGLGGDRMKERNKAMFDNLIWWQNRLGKDAKIIVWSVNTHVARAHVRGDIFDLGEYANDHFGQDVYTLGFTSASGTYAWGFREIRDVPKPSDTALEAIALKADISTVYLDDSALKATGKVPSLLIGYKRQEHNWSEMFDGVVIFKEGHPPTR